MEFWSRIDAARKRWDVLEHSFYERWSRGELSRSELSVYAGEYRHAVLALAQASENVAAAATDAATRTQLAAHAAEEVSHVALWDDFASALGADLGRTPATETVACADRWSGAGRSFAGHLAALYAIESAQPAISRTKAQGLCEFYGFQPGAATAYFDLHAELDLEHAAQARALLSGHVSAENEDELVAEAENVLKANWELLDGVERINAL